MLEPEWNGVELLNALKYIRPGGGYVPNFQLTATTDVNGGSQHPMFKYLKDCCPSVNSRVHTPILYDPTYTEDIKWNYEKFLVGPDGRPIYRYDEFVDPRTNVGLQDDIAKEVAKVKSQGSGTIVG